MSRRTPISPDRVARMVLEAALPPGDARYSRHEKAIAVRAVLLEGKSYRAAGELVRAHGQTVQRWVLETQLSLRAADPDRTLQPAA